MHTKSREAIDSCVAYRVQRGACPADQSCRSIVEQQWIAAVWQVDTRRRSRGNREDCSLAHQGVCGTWPPTWTIGKPRAAECRQNSQVPLPVITWLLILGVREIRRGQTLARRNRICKRSRSPIYRGPLP